MKENVPLTPDEFERAMKALLEKESHDAESFHVEADRLMCKLLRDSGYERGVNLFQDAKRWYA